MIDSSKYYVISYQHVDDYRSFRPLEEVFESAADKSKLISQLKNEIAPLFKNHGWEGDGEINCCFIPPVFFSDGENYCEIVYHVKQSNNGTSYFLIPNLLRDALHPPKDMGV